VVASHSRAFVGEGASGGAPLEYALPGDMQGWVRAQRKESPAGWLHRGVILPFQLCKRVLGLFSSGAGRVWPGADLSPPHILSYCSTMSCCAMGGGGGTFGAHFIALTALCVLCGDVLALGMQNVIHRSYLLLRPPNRAAGNSAKGHEVPGHPPEDQPPRKLSSRRGKG